MRKPMQGLRNVVRFNWPYYALAAVTLVLLLLFAYIFGGQTGKLAALAALLTASAVFISLLVTLYVYDLSGFYELKWLDAFSLKGDGTILNINAGFDETSELLTTKFPAATLTACDFFDAERHTEPSIARARRMYPPFDGTITVKTDRLPFEAGSIDTIFLIMSAHEIRDAKERDTFFAELTRVTSSNGGMVVVEHLRDIANFIAYNIGAFHFHSRRKWLKCFHKAELTIENEMKLTPFVRAFFLKKNGDAS